MTRPRSTGLLWLIVAVLMIALPALYIGSYYLMLRPHTERAWMSPDDLVFTSRPIYRAEGEVVAHFYWPARRLDCWIRPEPWEKENRDPEAR